MSDDDAQQFITGISIIDVFAPIALGSICRLQWCEGAGTNILTAELIRRFIRSGGRHVVCAGCLPDARQLQEWQVDLNEYELDDFITDDWLDTQSAVASVQLEEALDYTAELLSAGDDVLFVLLQPDNSEDWSKRASTRFKDLNTDRQYVILTVVNYGQEKAEVDAGDCTTRIVLDPARARAGLYPPVDPVMSVSSAGVEPSLEARRLAVVEKTRAAFVAYSDHDPDLQNLQNVLDVQRNNSDPDNLIALFRCCAQALYVATPYTGIAGVSRTMEQSIATFERALLNS